MAAAPMTMPTLTPPGGGVNPIKSTTSLGSLYAGGQNSSGMQMPVPNPGNPSSPTSSAPAAPSSAPSPASSGLTVSQNPGGAGSTGATGTNTGTFSGLTPTQAGDVLQGNQNTYGTGAGALLTSYLQTGAGYNGALAQQAVSATDTAMQQQINQQYGALQSSMAAAGLSPNSSASALAQSQFLSNASAQENAVAAQQYTQMYSQSQQDYLSAMEGELGISNSNTSVANASSLTGTIGGLFSGGVSAIGDLF